MTLCHWSSSKTKNSSWGEANGCVANNPCEIHAGREVKVKPLAYTPKPNKFGDKLILCFDISFVCPHYLPLSDHVHDLIRAYCSPGCRVGGESQTGLDPSFHEPMILLNHVVHITTRPSFTLLWQQTCFLQISNRTDIAAILIDVDYSWGSNVRSA